MTRRNWGIQDGLPDEIIRAVAETPEHYLWLGTPRSLIRFDGFHFTDLSEEIAPEIRDFGVTSLFAARDGSLWIATGSGTVFRLRGTAVKTYGTASGLRGFNVHALQEDASGSIWAGTNHGIYRLVGERFHRVTGIGYPSVQAIIPDGNGGLWIGGRYLIHYAHGRLQRITLPKQKTPTRIEALARTADGTLWIGTLGGLLRMDANGRLSPDLSVRREVKTLLVDRKHRLWVGTLDTGLYLRTAKDTFVHVAEATQGLSGTVLALLNDEDGDLWLGTHSGLIRLSNTGMDLTAIPAVQNARHASVALDFDGSLWVCAGKAYHLANGIVHTPKLPLVGNYPLRAILRDTAGSLWIATAGGGAIRVPRQGKPERFSAKVGTSYITGFLQGKDGVVWIATESGIAEWRNGDVVTFQHAAGAPHRPVLALAVAQGGVWAGTSHGLLRLRDGRFVADPAIAALGHHAVRALLGSSDGTLWIGTESGLFRWRNHRMLKAPLANNGGSSAVLSILQNPDGWLWLGGPDRVRRVRRAAIDHVLDSTAGDTATSSDQAGRLGAIVSEDFNVSTETDSELFGGMPSSVTTDGENGAWYISEAGPVHIYGNANGSSQASPPLVLQQAVIDGRPLSLIQDRTLSLPPSTNTLQIEATPVVLESHAGLQIRRKLIGFDKGWLPLPSSHMATYTNLSPGTYTYRVEASWGDWQEASSVNLKVIQEAHFYLQWWFMALCLILISIVIWLLHRQRVLQVAARFGAVAEERNRIAREMHDTILQGCIGISFLLDGIASQHQMQQAEETLQPLVAGQGWAVLKLARGEIERVIHEARVAIWNLRRSEDEAQLDRSLRELCNKITGNSQASALFKSIGPSLQLSEEQRGEVIMTVREALQNAIKHAGSEKIAVDLMYMATLVRIEIKDEGCGISHTRTFSGADGHFGVVGMRERMNRIGGTCTISSVEGHGTTVTLEIPVDSQLHRRRK